MANMLIPLDINSRFIEENPKQPKTTTKPAPDSPAGSEPTTPHSHSFNDDPTDSPSLLNTNTKQATPANCDDQETRPANPIRRAHSVRSYSSHEAGYSTWKFVSKFVEHVCMEGSLSDVQRQALLSNLAEVISMQIQMLDTVHAESKRVPVRCKPKLDLLRPDTLLAGESVLEPTPLRCYLVPDGREELSGFSSGHTVLLPAEGALFLTNYRLIYRGIPVNDSLMSDAVITRSFPISSLIKEKKIGNQYKVAAASR